MLLTRVRVLEGNEDDGADREDVLHILVDALARSRVLAAVGAQEGVQALRHCVQHMRGRAGCHRYLRSAQQQTYWQPSSACLHDPLLWLVGRLKDSGHGCFVDIREQNSGCRGFAADLQA